MFQRLSVAWLGGSVSLWGSGERRGAGWEVLTGDPECPAECCGLDSLWETVWNPKSLVNAARCPLKGSDCCSVVLTTSFCWGEERHSPALTQTGLQERCRDSRRSQEETHSNEISNLLLMTHVVWGAPRMPWEGVAVPADWAARVTHNTGWRSCLFGVFPVGQKSPGGCLCPQSVLMNRVK